MGVCEGNRAITLESCGREQITLSSECVTLLMREQAVIKDAVGWIPVPQRKQVIAFALPD